MQDLVFHIPTYTDDHSTFPKPINENYDYWSLLISYFLERSDTIEIHCWNEETDTIEEIKKLNLDSFQMVNEKYMTIFKGKKSPILTKHLLSNHIDNNGEFKWFTVNLDNGPVSVFHSSHWATEFFVTNASEKEIDMIKSVAPTETSFDLY